MPAPSITLEPYTTFGDLLKFLRRRAGLTQRELSIAVGYSGPQVSRLEQNLRLPALAMIGARFVPALDLDAQPRAGAGRRARLGRQACRGLHEAGGAIGPGYIGVVGNTRPGRGGRQGRKHSPTSRVPNSPAVLAGGGSIRRAVHTLPRRGGTGRLCRQPAGRRWHAGWDGLGGHRLAARLLRPLRSVWRT